MLFPIQDIGEVLEDGLHESRVYLSKIKRLAEHCNQPAARLYLKAVDHARFMAQWLKPPFTNALDEPAEVSYLMRFSASTFSTRHRKGRPPKGAVPPPYQAVQYRSRADVFREISATTEDTSKVSQHRPHFGCGKRYDDFVSCMYRCADHGPS